jgi:AcrR family transcriptional regulator
MPDAPSRTDVSKQVRKRRERGSISTDLIIAGAFEVARASSLDELSMPVLADHLDVAVTSIYWHFRKKEELLRAMTEVAIAKQHASIPVPGADETWQEVLRRQMTTIRALHREDEVLSDLVLRTPTYSREATERAMEELERTVAKLVGGGFTRRGALQAINAIMMYTRGIITYERTLRRSNAAILGARQRSMIDWSGTPLLGSLVDEQPLSGTADSDFEFGISRFIAGFEALLDDLEDGGG